LTFYQKAGIIKPDKRTRVQTNPTASAKNQELEVKKKFSVSQAENIQ